MAAERKVKIDFERDESGFTAGYLALQEGNIAKRFPQYEDRVLDFGLDGELLGIEFLDSSIIDLTNLPQDEVIPSQDFLDGYFSVIGFDTAIDIDLT